MTGRLTHIHITDLMVPFLSCYIYRHPYIERITQMYLMKLNFPSFGSNRAAAAWRQVLVAAIMPWFRKFRVFREERLLQSLQSLYLNKPEEDINLANVCDEVNLSILLE